MEEKTELSTDRRELSFGECVDALGLVKDPTSFGAQEADEMLKHDALATSRRPEDNGGSASRKRESDPSKDPQAGKTFHDALDAHGASDGAALGAVESVGC